MEDKEYLSSKLYRFVTENFKKLTAEQRLQMFTLAEVIEQIEREDRTDEHR